MTDHQPASQDEQRALSREEMELSDQARQPALGRLSDKDLSDLVGLLRVRRNRARDIAARQGREARGKAGPRGTNPAGGNAGTQSKAGYLTAALDRASEERDRRAGTTAPGTSASDTPSQKALSEKAAAMKDDAASPMLEGGGPLHPSDPDADPGKAGLAQTQRDTAPSGALDHAGDLPARERSRERG